MLADNQISDYEMKSTPEQVVSVGDGSVAVADVPTFFIPAAPLWVGKVFRVAGNLFHRIALSFRRQVAGFLSHCGAEQRFQGRVQLRNSCMVRRR